jgi:glycosyltransferase involved in cell wall biosynthesis
VRRLKRRLLFVVESGTDVRLVEGLAEHFDLTIIARKIEGGVEISQPPSAQFEMILAPASRISFGRFVFYQLLRRRSQTDVVLVQGYSLAALAANAARIITSTATIMLVCSPIEAYYYCRVAHAVGPRYRKHEAFLLYLLARANALTGDTYVVLSEYLKSVVRAHGGKSIHNIPIYGVDIQIFHPPTKSKPELKSELGLPADGTLVFFSSRVAPEKDSETLLRAVRHLLDQGENIWLLHRSGGYRQFLADADKFGIAHRVIATDAIHPHRGLPLDYRACDVCVQASREEGLGFSPLEALACHTPVIATSVGGLKETILDGHTGWTYPVGDAASLANCLYEVIANPAEATNRARRGREMVREKFDRRVVFRQFTHFVELHSGGAVSQPLNVTGEHENRINSAIERKCSESVQISFARRLADSAIHLLRANHGSENASTMVERTVFAIPAVAEPIVVDNDTTQEIPVRSAPRFRRSYALSPQRSLNIVMAIHTPRDLNTAVHKNTRERAQYLEARGHHCTIITPDDIPSLHRMVRLKPVLYPIAIARWLSKHQGVDVILFHSYAGWAASLAQRYLGAMRHLRTAIVFHGLEPIYYARLKHQADMSGAGLSWRYRLMNHLVMKLLRASARRADVLMCLNSEEARYLLDNDWASKGRVTVLANPAPASFFIERNHRERTTQLLYVGQWLPMKGTCYLIEAFTKLSRDHPGLRLCCAGTLESESNVLRSFPAEVRGHVTVHPRVNEQELLDLHRAADIFVFPTLSEGFSLALVEAMASGLPVVTTRVGAAPDILIDRRSALFVPTHNTTCMIDSIKELMQDRSLRTSLGDAAQLAAERLRPEFTLKDFEVCFQLLASGRNPGRQ